MKSISNAFDSQITLPLQFTYVTLGHQRAEHTLASIGDYLRTTVPMPQAPAMGGGQSPSEHWHSQPRDDGCPEGRLSSRVRHRESQEPRGPGVLGPSTCRCWRLRCRVLAGRQRGKQCPIPGSGARSTGMAPLLCHHDCAPSGRPHGTTVPFTCVHSASHGTDAKAHPEDARWAENRVDAEIQGGNSSMETVCFSFILKLLNIHLLVEPLMQRKSRVRGRALL